jgi:hypothetical protein
MAPCFRSLSAFALVASFAFSLSAQQPAATKTGTDATKTTATTASKPSVSGSFKGNGKESKIAFVSARWREGFNDKPGIRLIFTEKDHTQDPKADFNANFGRYGSALNISLHPDGGIFGCEVTHSAHRGGFSALGKIKINDFKFENGVLQGQLTTGGPDDVFGQTWDVDLKFSAPLAGSPPQPAPAETKTAKSSTSGKDRQQSIRPATSDSAAPAAPTLPALNVKELPIPPDATDVEYKKLVQHIGFNSPSDYKAVATDLVKKLTAQGWKIDGADRVAAKPKILPKSYILDCKRGDATLTIFVKPADAGSHVTIMSKGLSWDSP